MKAAPILLPIAAFLFLTSTASASEIQLADRRALQTELYEARLISEINGYAILSGRSCVDCDENTSIYIHRIADGDFNNPATAERFTYPGKYADYETKKLVEKTRMFYGQCYESEPALLWLSEYLGGEGWVKAEYLVVFGEEGLEHRYNENRQPSIYYIENRNCVELPGITAETEP